MLYRKNLTGETITVKGRNFLAGLPLKNKLTVGGKVVAVMAVPDANTLTFKVPAGLGSGLLEVAIEGKTTCQFKEQFTYYYTATKIDVTAGRVNSTSCGNVNEDCLSSSRGIAIDLTIWNDPSILYIRYQ